MSIPIPRACWAVTIDATNNVVTFTSGGNTYTCTLTAGSYATPELLLAHLATQLSAATRSGPVAFSADVGAVTCSLSETGRVSISFGAGATIRFADSAIAQALGTLLGFGTSNVVTSSFIATATKQIHGMWTPDIALADDSLEYADRDYAYSRSVTGQKAILQGTAYRRAVKLAWVPYYKVRAYTTSIDGRNRTAEDLGEWLGTPSAVGSFTWSPDRSAPSTDAATYAFAETPIVKDRPNLTIDRYDFELQFVRLA